MKKQIPQRQIDILFDRYTASHLNPVNKVINWICIPLVVFALLGLAWSIPFPYLGFLGKYNGYINWASLLIAFSVYFCLKFSPVLSYGFLFVLFIFSYCIIMLDAWLKAHGMFLGSVCMVLLIIAFTAQFIGQNMEGKRYSVLNSVKFLLLSPIWLLSLVLKRFNIKY